MQNVQGTKDQQFERLLEDYNACKLHYESLPKNKVVPGVKFDSAGYKLVETSRVLMDLALANLVMVKQELVDFLEVQKDGSVTIMMYNPFGNYLDTMNDMTYEYVEVSDKKTKVYTTAANDSIKWCIKIMNGDVNILFRFKLGKWFTEKDIKADCEGFCKDVAIIIRYYPHVDLKTNQDYIAVFFEWFNELEEDDIMRMNILNGILEELKKCFFPNKRQEFEKEGTLETEIYFYSSTMCIQDCSKKCHEKFLKLRIGSEKKKSFLDGIKLKGLERKAAIEAKLNGKSITENKKRPREETENEEARDSKKPKTSLESKEEIVGEDEEDVNRHFAKHLEEKKRREEEIKKAEESNANNQ